MKTKSWEVVSTQRNIPRLLTSCPLSMHPSFGSLRKPCIKSSLSENNDGPSFSGYVLMVIVSYSSSMNTLNTIKLDKSSDTLLNQ